MLPNLLCLSGWAQKYDSLEIIFANSSIKEKYAINSLDYSKLNNIENVYLEMNDFGKCEVALGWSLGGQILVRAIANGVIKPEYLILIAAPFQMLKDLRISSN